VAVRPQLNAGLLARRNGWTILLYPALRAELLTLRERVRRVRAQDPSGWQSNGHAKLLRRIVEIILHDVPAGPASPVFEQGNTIGKDARGWRRAKFLGRFRLFYRFDSRSKIIIYAWANDETTMRARGSDNDPYVVFRRMLLAGDPPHAWDQLLAASLAPVATEEHDNLKDLLSAEEPASVVPDAIRSGRTRRRKK
jgi:toxin YhaV